MHILMIEDDAELAELLDEYLQTRQIQTTVALTPLEGLELLQKNLYDAVVLDLSLPQMDGLEICRIIRKQSTIPIIISSARSDIKDKSSSFLRGADDFLPKPYDPEELVLRLYAILRRFNPQNHNQPCFVVDEPKREIYKKGIRVSLTPAEYEIVAYMISKNGAVVSRNELLLNIDAKPIYEEFDGWDKSEGVDNYDDLPENAKKYISKLEDLVGVKMGIISTGADRRDTIILS
jgi:two-component system OmpR family response regulator